jgi:hypothetical protein
MFVLGGIGMIPPARGHLILGETIGYIGRTGSAYDVTFNNWFIMQICCLIISPAFFSAAIYLTIGNLAVIVGKANALLKPMFYVIIFSSFDFIALVVQAVGGAGASEAEQKGTDTRPSTHIMVPSPSQSLSFLPHHPSIET